MFGHDGIDPVAPPVAGAVHLIRSPRSCGGRAHRQSPSNRLAGRAGVVDGVLGIAVAEIVLDQPQVVAAVGKVKPQEWRSMCGCTVDSPARAAAAARR